MSWNAKKYSRINWKNRPSTATALGATNLNKIDVFCNEVDNHLIEIDAGKLDLATANSMIASIEVDTKSGIITARQLDGATHTWDLNVEKIPVSFTLSEDGTLTMTTDDGTEFTTNINDAIKHYEFIDSDTIDFDKTGDGPWEVTAIVKDGSINEKHLNPDYRADIIQTLNEAETAAQDALTYSKDSKRWAVGDPEYSGSETDNAKYYAQLAESYAHGDTEVRDGEDTDNSKFWSEQSKLEAERAKVEADKAESYSYIMAPDFYLDTDDMYLYMKGGVGIDFMVTDDNVLLWAVE